MKQKIATEKCPFVFTPTGAPVILHQTLEFHLKLQTCSPNIFELHLHIMGRGFEHHRHKLRITSHFPVSFFLILLFIVTLW